MNLYIHSKEQSLGKTILYSHSSTVTLGHCYSFLYDLSTQLYSDIIAYDYTGYGHSNKGSTTDDEMKSDIKEVYKFIEKYPIPAEEVVLFAKSIGSIPSIYLSSLKQDILGMILLSPLASAAALLMKNKTKQDNNEEEIESKPAPYSVLHLVSLVKIPVLIIHGIEDNVIPYSHSIDIGKRLTSVSQWFPKNGTHMNIIEDYRVKFYNKVGVFIRIINQIKKNEALKRCMLYNNHMKNENENDNDKRNIIDSFYENERHSDEFSEIGITPKSLLNSAKKHLTFNSGISEKDKDDNPSNIISNRQSNIDSI